MLIISAIQLRMFPMAITYFQAFFFFNRQILWLLRIHTCENRTPHLFFSESRVAPALPSAPLYRKAVAEFLTHLTGPSAFGGFGDLLLKIFLLLDSEVSRLPVCLYPTRKDVLPLFLLHCSLSLSASSEFSS